MISPVPVGNSSASAEQALGRLVEALTARLQAGEAVDLDACIREHPEHAERLAQLLPALRLLAEVGRSAGSAEAAPTATEEIAGTLGDFRLLREVGRGGMGVVYEAEQISLNRRVALKVLPLAATLDARQLQRFKNEAQAAACLHHTNIVPVHAVGCERGVHYYAMQFIDGQTLAEVIRDLRQAAGLEVKPPDSDLPTPTVREPTALMTEYSHKDGRFFRTVARLGAQAAEALEHAHRLGVVHRDVKPANLLLDSRGNVWVTDFGLAQFQTDTRLTMTGDLLGTLRYMSPEQASARHVVVDHRTDVYSLGATLYELLTLQPVFGGRDRQELLQQITVDEPRPLRQLHKAIPADLETIVLKALEKYPIDRYATAQELADELRRFVEDKPIRTRRATLSQRIQKGARKHRSVLGAAGVGLAIAAAVLAGSSLLLWQNNRELHRTLAERDEQNQRAERHREQADSNLAKALNGMTELLDEVDSNETLDEHQRTILRQALAGHMERFFQRIQDGTPTDPRTRWETGWAYQHLGVYYLRLGDFAHAEKEYRKALAIHESLARERPEEPEVIRMYAASLEPRDSSLPGRPDGGRKGPSPPKLRGGSALADSRSRLAVAL